MIIDHVKLQIASDLHLEFSRYDFDVKRIGNCLALVGDIGSPLAENYKSFIAKQSEKYEHVFVVAGNHEYYKGEYHTCNNLIQDICSEFPNVHFLKSTSYLYQTQSSRPIRFLGCTLWSNVPEEHSLTVYQEFNDYYQIKVDVNGKKRLLEVEDTNKWHREQVSWLKSEIAKAKENNERVVVLTHHAPLMKGTSRPQLEQKNRSINYAFATDLSDMMDGSRIELWAYGHTHYNNVQNINGTICVSNQAGYVHEEEKEVGYNPDQCFIFNDDCCRKQ
ncbi:Ser/Thr protein phosphatase [Acrasis kona]|uniref:Ser/Thr protein phosphatase n=1 Tax=Acrasis kona TaxID=1008807 RepID=A0AAW2Z659_9EUKA